MPDNFFEAATYNEARQAVEIYTALVDLEEELRPLDEAQSRIRKEMLKSFGQIVLMPFLTPFPIMTIRSMVNIYRHLDRHAEVHLERKDVSGLALQGIKILDELRFRYPTDQLIKDIRKAGRRLFQSINLDPDY